MNCSTNLVQKIEEVQQLFKATTLFLEKPYRMSELYDFLEVSPKEFRAVGYECASMQIGLNDLSKGIALDNWIDFYEGFQEKYPAHLESGLGWAFAKLGQSPNPFLPNFSRLSKWLIFDGVGYYSGLFNNRKTIKNKIIPSYISGQDLLRFDQGLGRQLWYIAKGDLDKLLVLLHTFDIQRQPDLWRGIGIATAYLGGNQQETLHQLYHIAGEHSIQLRIGTAWAAVSRTASETINLDIIEACQILCKKLLEVVVNQTKIQQELFEAGIGQIDQDWLEPLKNIFG